MVRFHDRVPVVFGWRDAETWMADERPGDLLHPPSEDALQEWIVSSRVNRSGAGDDVPTLVEPTST